MKPSCRIPLSPARSKQEFVFEILWRRVSPAPFFAGIEFILGFSVPLSAECVRDEKHPGIFSSTAALLCSTRHPEGRTLHGAIGARALG
jgi:hypothetical protein